MRHVVLLRSRRADRMLIWNYRPCGRRGKTEMLSSLTCARIVMTFETQRRVQARAEEYRKSLSPGDRFAIRRASMERTEEILK